MKNKVYIICGPTSSGKTSLALDLCKKYGGEIVSADSRQICKGMDIGTGKIPVNYDFSLEEEEEVWIVDGVKVWGYDLFSLDEYFSGVDWANYALRKIREVLDKGKNVFVVGGTGFYLDLFTDRVKPSSVKPDFELRKELEVIGLEDLQNKLRELSVEEFRKIDKYNKVRLIRAIEKNISKEKREIELPYLDIDFVWIGLKSPREFLYERADNWVDKVWSGGLLEETKDLLKRYPDSSKLKGLVYKTVSEYLNESLDEKEAIQRIKFDLHAYIRRQQTYLKRNTDITWVDISKDDFKQIIYNIIDG
ncbi:tRNA (adenosine(37)-N6)-dimethylallyltransferase MiaA [Patescibacteria group bacterium]|nr:tRNA (adenosine(37)-N6)-dimethylallyltransferase MiaA [Patescibacteria group bacterium]